MIPSDALAALRTLVEANPSIAPLVKMMRFRIVVDANSILRDLYWIHKKRKNKNARSDLREIIDSGVAIAFAPHALEREVIARFAFFSAEYGIPEGDLHTTWSEYRKVIRWLEPTRSKQRTSTERDPSDAPYVALALQIGAVGVYTHDKDYESFAVRSIDKGIVLQMRTYARLTATDLTIKVGGASAVLVSATVLLEAFRFGKKIWAGFRTLPESAQLVIGGLIVGLLVYEPTRRWLTAKLKVAGDFAFSALVATLETAANTIDETGRELKNVHIDHLQNSTPMTLAGFSAVVIADAGRPLALSDIAHRVLQSGYATRSKDVRKYLSRVLASDSRFVRLPDGRYNLAPIEGLLYVPGF